VLATKVVYPLLLRGGFLSEKIPQLPTLPFCPDEVSSSHTLQGIPYWLLSVEKTPDLLCSESFRVFSKQGEDRLTHGPR
jgi:hypothetical protein